MVGTKNIRIKYTKTIKKQSQQGRHLSIPITMGIVETNIEAIDFKMPCSAGIFPYWTTL